MGDALPSNEGDHDVQQLIVEVYPVETSQLLSVLPEDGSNFGFWTEEGLVLWDLPDCL